MNIPQNRELSPRSIFTVALLMIFGPSIATAAAGGIIAIWTNDDFWLLLRTGWMLGVGVFGLITLIYGSTQFSQLLEQIAQATAQPKVIQIASPKRAEIRLVPLRTAPNTRLVDGIPEEDLRWFVRHICVHGHSQRASLGQKAPSGRVVDAEYWGELSGPLRKTGVITGVKPRSAGVLAHNKEATILSLLGLN